MTPLIVLIAVFCLTELLALVGVRALEHDQWPLRCALSAMFLLTASAHFGSRSKTLVAMVPPVLPNPKALVAITGVLELAGAVGLLVPTLVRLAAAALAVFLVAIFPANVYAASSGVKVPGPLPTPLPLRALIQVVFIAVAIWIFART